MIRQSTTICLAALLALPFAGAINQMVPGADIAQAANRVNLSISPNADRYPRGKQLRITVQVRGENRAPLVGTLLLVQEIYYDSARRRTVERTLTTTTTNHEGRVVLDYQVPLDPNKDKVTLVFVNPVANGDSASFVIPIGR